MNQITTQKPVSTPATAYDEGELLRVLGQSQYPGAKPESIKMVVDYCRAAGLNPMLKPVHIVPMSVKQKGPNGREEYVYRDVIMPGIGHYRTQASRTGQYVGKSEPEFGPDVTQKLGGVEVTYPKWCKITVQRRVGHEVASFTAVEFWVENYATSGRDSNKPNSMWLKRPYGQLAKVAEAQALRQAFPELLGEETAEEMEGKEIDAVRDITPAEEAKQTKADKARAAGKSQLDGFANVKPKQDVIDGEIVDTETGEVADDLPAMPEEAAFAFANGKWGKAWKWFIATIAELPEAKRQAMTDRHAELLRMVAAYGENWKEAVMVLAKNMGVNFDAGKAD